MSTRSKKTPTPALWAIGLLQATSIFTYGTIIIAAIFYLEANLSPVIFPIVAVLSVLVAALATLARPFYLFFYAKKPRDTFVLIGWTVFWLVLILIGATLINQLYFSLD